MTALHFLAEDETQARLVSALVQDAILSSADVTLDGQAQVAALLISRFRWEAKGAPSRVRSLLVVRHVTGAARLRWPRTAAPLDLLALRVAPSWLRLDFADGIGLRLTVQRLRVALEDVGDPWSVRRRPQHRT